MRDLIGFSSTRCQQLTGACPEGVATGPVSVQDVLSQPWDGVHRLTAWLADALHEPLQMAPDRGAPQQ